MTCRAPADDAGQSDRVHCVRAASSLVCNVRPTLWPSDITGVQTCFNRNTRCFEFSRRTGYLRTSCWRHELNRDHTENAECVARSDGRRQVTIDAVLRTRMSKRFFVIATQNPIDSQRRRIVCPKPPIGIGSRSKLLKIGYPDRASQLGILEAAASVDSHRGAGPRGLVAEEELGENKNR